MCKDIRIDFVTPPFPGHLFPALELAEGLKRRGFSSIRILSTQSAKEAVVEMGLDFIDILPGRDAEVKAIADPPNPVRSNPFELMAQFRKNIGLMSQIKGNLQDLWDHHSPDLAVVDFTVPIAGITAQSRNIAWWTGLPTPCALETRNGVPAYLGGWKPKKGIVGQIRNNMGWKWIRIFKTLVVFMFRKELKNLDIKTAYRADGTEAAYSNEKILAYGLEEFELPRNWPDHVHFVGPLTQSPQFEHTVPRFNPERPTILITIGTHLPWMRETIQTFAESLSNKLPEVDIHLTMGNPEVHPEQQFGNVRLYSYLPYQTYLKHYSIAIIHGGTGATYSCIKQGIPMLVWPIDYDQFDHAVRIEHNQLGDKLPKKPAAAATLIRRILNNPNAYPNLSRFQERILTHSPLDSVEILIRNSFD